MQASWATRNHGRVTQPTMPRTCVDSAHDTALHRVTAGHYPSSNHTGFSHELLVADRLWDRLHVPKPSATTLKTMADDIDRGTYTGR
jgi:hypothetical protein